MRNLAFILIAIGVLASCSTPKYAYKFDHYDYNSGKAPAKISDGPEEALFSPLVIEEPVFSASTSRNVMPTQASQTLTSNKTESEVLAKNYKSLTKTERKEFRKEVKKEFKNYVKAVKNGDHVQVTKATSVMDNDLRMAIIFGAVGLTLTLFGGVNEAFAILGVIAIVVGVVFLIKWLLRQ